MERYRDYHTSSKNRHKKKPSPSCAITTSSWPVCLLAHDTEASEATKSITLISLTGQERCFTPISPSSLFDQQDQTATWRRVVWQNLELALSIGAGGLNGGGEGEKPSDCQLPGFQLPQVTSGRRPSVERYWNQIGLDSIIPSPDRGLNRRYCSPMSHSDVTFRVRTGNQPSTLDGCLHLPSRYRLRHSCGLFFAFCSRTVSLSLPRCSLEMIVLGRHGWSHIPRIAVLTSLLASFDRSYGA